MNPLIQNYLNAKQIIYDHVGFQEDWVYYPIEDFTKYVWSCDGGEVKYADSIEQYNSDGDYYIDEVYTQRFYKQHVYEGKDFTLIMCDPGVDGAKWMKLFDNTKRIKD